MNSAKAMKMQTTPETDGLVERVRSVVRRLHPPAAVMLAIRISRSRRAEMAAARDELNAAIAAAQRTPRPPDAEAKVGAAQLALNEAEAAVRSARGTLAEARAAAEPAFAGAIAPAKVAIAEAVLEVARKSEEVREAIALLRQAAQEAGHEVPPLPELPAFASERAWAQRQVEK